MTSIRALKSFLFLGALTSLASCAPQTEAPPAPAAVAAAGNPITGEGFPNPAPNLTKNWGTLPEGRQWGSSAGVDIDPADGHIWAYERCGAGTFGAGVPRALFKFQGDAPDCDVTRDGQRFLCLTLGAGANTPIVVLQNWWLALKVTP